MRLGQLRIGLLPCYLKLYDDVLPDTRAGFDGFLGKISAALESREIAVHMAPICRIAKEFDEAISGFEAAGVDAVVTVHLAYSPSLEIIDAAAGTFLPLILLDTTMDADFGLAVSPDRIMYNHGVHGVMDFANMLRRREQPFEIVAGHVDDAAMMDAAAELVHAARAAVALRDSHVLRVGKAFKGMGDFAVEDTVLAAGLGIQIEEVGLKALDEAIKEVTDDEVAVEVAADRQRYTCDLPAEAHERSVRVGLGLRRLLEDDGYTGFSVNFQAFDLRPNGSPADRPANTMPFLEISKAMGRGLGYAGEGDVLTASLVGALAQAFGATTFTEIFCPDWAGDALFLSHMGEISPTVAADKPRVFAKPFFGGGSLDPAVLSCAMKPGPAVFVNLAPGPDDSFSLILAPVEVLAEDETLDPAMRDVVRAWIRPKGGIARFLEAYSRAGGTHHSALVLGEKADVLAAFGRMSGLEVVRIG